MSSIWIHQFTEQWTTKICFPEEEKKKEDERWYSEKMQRKSKKILQSAMQMQNKSVIRSIWHWTRLRLKWKESTWKLPAKMEDNNQGYAFSLHSPEALNHNCRSCLLAQFFDRKMKAFPNGNYHLATAIKQLVTSC